MQSFIKIIALLEIERKKRCYIIFPKHYRLIVSTEKVEFYSSLIRPYKYNI